MWTPPHPDRRDVPIPPRADLPRDEPARDRIELVPDVKSEWAEDEVVRREVAALTVGKREHGVVVAQRPGAPLVIERQPQVVDRVRTWSTLLRILGRLRRPLAGEIELRKGRRADEHAGYDESRQPHRIHASSSSGPAKAGHYAIRVRLPDAPRGRVPFAAIAFLLEVQRRDPGLSEILVVPHRAGDRDPLIAVGSR